MTSVLVGLDAAVLRELNSLVGGSWSLDQVILEVRTNPIFKGIVPMMMLWGLWFGGAAEGMARNCLRAQLLATVLVACAAIAIGRALALWLPFRLRPIHTEGLALKTPQGFDAAGTLDGWSSMPSDHAVLFFALATGIFAVHRTLGSLAFLHAAMVVSLPRVVVGVHYPSDILVGALAGVTVAALLGPVFVALTLRWGLLAQERARPGLFYALMLAVTFQVASIFDSLRALLGTVAEILLA
ncbi:phosphatase PAP2 family protein [Rubellimicrobium rubrum]|uniref:phosphatase PAP2 family protein n=1 Tax=Rubellimicrobium rubrum TaxID=2585369 RepID=UPI00159B9379|nr:phosphatase PAP2 family protein [Rubellimicrobium rubrum]